MRYALRFAYDGQAFDGYARQPEGRTVEGEVLAAMKSLGIIEETAQSRFQSASRTDKGVSALGNVIAFDTGFPRKGIVPALNANLEAMHFHGIADVPDDFNPRHAKLRWYRYLLPEPHPPIKSLGEVGELFVDEHDFGLFSKKDTGEENTVLTIDEISFMKMDGYSMVDVKAQRFLWQLVRRMLSAIIEVASDKLEPEKVIQMLDGSALRLAHVNPLPPEPLILMDVQYDIEFEPMRSPGEYFAEQRDRAQSRSRVMAQLINGLKNV